MKAIHTQESTSHPRFQQIEEERLIADSSLKIFSFQFVPISTLFKNKCFKLPIAEKVERSDEANR
jgi:hypothetical protein